MSGDAYAKAGVDQGAADSAVAGLVKALGAIQLGPALAAGAAARPLRERDQARRADRDRALHRRRRDEAAARRGARALRHDRDRLRGDERQRRDLRRRRATGDARLHRDRPGRPGGLRGSRRRPGPRGGAGRDRDPRRRAGPARRDGARRRRLRRLLRHRRPGRDRRRLGGPAGRRDHRPPLLRPALQRLHAGPLGARRVCPRTRTPKAGSAARSARSCSSRPRSTSSRCSSCCAPGSRCAASPTSPRAASATSTASPPTSATRSTPRSRCPPIFELIQERSRRLRRGDAPGLQHGLRLLLRRRPEQRSLGARPACGATTPARSASASPWSGEARKR